MGCRVLLVGEAPGPRGRPDCPLYPLPERWTGGRLRSMSGLSVREYLDRTIRLNLVPEYPGRRWPAVRARAAAENIRGSGLMRSRRVVMVGARVWAAFFPERGGREPLTVVEGAAGALALYLPHPSGRNRWYNDPGNREAARAALARVFDK